MLPVYEMTVHSVEELQAKLEPMPGRIHVLQVHLFSGLA